MTLADIPSSALIACSVSSVASFLVTLFVWRRKDHFFMKVAITFVAFLPIVGPLFALWAINFPDKMHPDMQAKYKRQVNSYSVPKEAIKQRVLGKSDSA